MGRVWIQESLRKREVIVLLDVTLGFAIWFLSRCLPRLTEDDISARNYLTNRMAAISLLKCLLILSFYNF